MKISPDPAPSRPSDQRAVSVRPEGAFRTVPGTAPGASLEAAPQVAKGSASSNRWVSRAGQSPQTGSTTILVPDSAPLANGRLNRRDLAALHAKLTDRDLAILIALARYRYLEMRQLQHLFFPSERTTQLRVRHLLDLSLIRRWRLCESNFRWHPSVVMISARGAALVASAIDRDRRYLIELAHAAADKRSKFLRVLRANWFFVDLAAASDRLRRHGLYHWVGVSDLRSEPRAGRHLERPISDGWGRFLTPDGDITFDLDWDRADLPKHFLQRRVDDYFHYSMDRCGAELAHVLFVARTEAGERSLVGAVRRSRRIFVDTCHRSWVTTMARLRQDGPLGPIWRYVPCLREEPGEWQPPPPEQRLRLDQIPKKPLTERDLRGCVGRPQWWRFRASGAGGP